MGFYQPRPINAKYTLHTMDSEYDGALVALESEMRLNLSVEGMLPLLERDAGGFMIRAEKMQVTSVNRENTPELVSRIVSILRKKGNEQFFIFLNILDNSGNEVWANKPKEDMQQCMCVCVCVCVYVCMCVHVCGLPHKYPD